MKAIIVGATSGIGLEVTRLLAAKGWELGIAGRRAELLTDIQQSIPNVKAIRRLDITVENAAEELKMLIQDLGGMDLYFHSSGIGWQNMSLDEEKEIATAMTNCVGFTRMITAAFHYFEGKGCGHIAAISSIAGTKGLGAAPAYSSTKRYQNHYLECLQQQAQMRKLNIKFTDIRPGFVATDLLKGDTSYPLQLSAHQVAKSIVNGLERQKEIVTIDWRYRILVSLWRLIPRFLWVRLPIYTQKPKSK